MARHRVPTPTACLGCGTPFRPKTGLYAKGQRWFYCDACRPGRRKGRKIGCTPCGRWVVIRQEHPTQCCHCAHPSTHHPRAHHPATLGTT